MVLVYQYTSMVVVQFRSIVDQHNIGAVCELQCALHLKCYIVMYNVHTYCNVPDSLRVNIQSLSDPIPAAATHVGPLKKCLRPQSSQFHYFSFNFCPSSERTSHILAIVPHFIALDSTDSGKMKIIKQYPLKL